MPDKVIDHLGNIPPRIIHRACQGNRPFDVPIQKPAEQIREDRRIRSAQNIQYMLIGQQLAVVKCKTLVQQAQGVSHRSVSRLCNILQRLRLDLHAFTVRDLLQMLRDRLPAHSAEIITLAAAQYRRRYLLRVGRGQNKDHVGRRLLQGLEQRIKRARRKHVHLVDYVYLKPPRYRRIFHLVADIADVVNAVIGCRVDLEHIHRAPGIDRPADFAFIAGIASELGCMRTVYRAGKDLGRRCLAGSPCTTKEIGMTYPVGFDLILQRRYDCVLSHDLTECGGTPFAVKCLVRHSLGFLIHKIQYTAASVHTRKSGTAYFYKVYHIPMPYGKKIAAAMHPYSSPVIRRISLRRLSLRSFRSSSLL